jgi:endo-alpha-1,4-polygalactosaminidase (GH114 family)
MEYLTVKEMAIKWNVSSRMVNTYCKEQRVAGAIKKGNLWLIPQNAEKPVDMRKNNGRKSSLSTLKAGR